MQIGSGTPAEVAKLISKRCAKVPLFQNKNLHILRNRKTACLPFLSYQMAKSRVDDIITHKDAEATTSNDQCLVSLQSQCGLSALGNWPFRADA